jgi:hypothetical protein
MVSLDPCLPEELLFNSYLPKIKARSRKNRAKIKTPKNSTNE